MIFLNSGPLSDRMRSARRPLLNMHLDNARRTSDCIKFLTGSSKTPCDKQQKYVRTYLHPWRSGGLLGPSKSIMTSDQQSQSSGFTATCSGRVGRLRNLIQLMHDSVQASTSLLSDDHHTNLSNRMVIFYALLCAPKTPIWFCNQTHRFQLRCTVALPAGTTGTHEKGLSFAMTPFSNNPSCYSKTLFLVWIRE